MLEVSWLLFIVTSLVVIVTPGQDMILVMSRSLTQGSSAGVVTAAGVSIGLIGHTILVTLGLGAILRTSEWLFLALRLFGAAYLIYLGIALVCTKKGKLALGVATQSSYLKLFLDGCLSNILNPKIAIFYFAFLPQFVHPNTTHTTLVIMGLGIIFAILTFLVKALIGLFAGFLSGWLRRRLNVLAWLYRFSGVVLLGLGVKLAFERRV